MYLYKHPLYCAQIWGGGGALPDIDIAITYYTRHIIYYTKFLFIMWNSQKTNVAGVIGVYHSHGYILIVMLSRQN